VRGARRQPGFSTARSTSDFGGLYSALSDHMPRMLFPQRPGMSLDNLTLISYGNKVSACKPYAYCVFTHLQTLEPSLYPITFSPSTHQQNSLAQPVQWPLNEVWRISRSCPRMRAYYSWRPVTNDCPNSDPLLQPRSLGTPKRTTRVRQSLLLCSDIRREPSWNSTQIAEDHGKPSFGLSEQRVEVRVMGSFLTTP
jgi:hypothetical protein